MKNNEEALSRQLLQHILLTWNAIKGLRQQQNYSTTSVQLFLKKYSKIQLHFIITVMYFSFNILFRQDVNPEADRAAWEADIMQELKEREEDYQDWYEKQIELINSKKEVNIF